MLDALLATKNTRKKQRVTGSGHLLSLVKGISWRIVGSIDTMIIAYLITGKVHAAISIGSVEVFTKIFLFYVHDRTWEYFLKRKKKLSEA